MPAIMPRPRRALGVMTAAEITAVEDGPAPGTFAAYILAYPADGTPPGDLAAELRDDLAAGCLPAADMTPARVRAHLDTAHSIAGWVPGALARLERGHLAAAPAPLEAA